MAGQVDLSVLADDAARARSTMMAVLYLSLVPSGAVSLSA